ncbi:MAG: type IV pilus secretin PilQ [Acidobacteriota bacterium]|nr:type IV pilus secretin PilQ [Acidobacteriota bacterium]
MRFKRLLTVALMALCFGAGSATAASQLNSVQVVPKGNTATISLKTTGTFAHREYRPDDHLVLIDLSGVSADAAVARAAAPNSDVLKSYKVTSYTSASGDEVTRLELVLGDGVNFNVADMSDGLNVVLSNGPIAEAAPARTPAYAQTVTRPAADTEPVVASAAPAPAKPAAVKTPSYAAREKTSASGAPVVIEGISVVQGREGLEIVIRGPQTAAPFVLQNPDRLVMDFHNAVARPSLRKVSVQSKDVAEVRVGRYQAEPPVTRVVVDLKGPHSYEVSPATGAVIVRVKSAEAATAPAQAATSAPAVGEQASSPAAVQPSYEIAAATPDKESEKQSGTPAADEKQAPALSPAPANETAKAQAPQAEAVKVEAAKVEAEKKIEPATIKTTVEPVNQVTAKATPAPVHPVMQDKVLAAKETESAREAEITTVSDPSLRAGRAAEKMATAPSPMASLNIPASPIAQQAADNAAAQATAKSKYTGEPISVNLKDVDLKDFFRLIHEISGLNIVLDPSVRGTVTLVLDDVPWDQALDIVLKNNGLDRELQGNVLRIAATDTLRREAVDRRAQSEAVALAVDRQTITHFLSYAKAAEVMPTVKKFLSSRGDVIADVRTNALIISDIPSVIPNLQNLIQKLDKKSEEVEIEVRVVSATRSFSRDLGVQLGFNWGNGVTTLGGNDPNSTTGSSTSAGAVTTSTVPLFSNFPASGATTSFSLSNITKSYGIDAVLTAAESHNLAKVLSRPRVVTQNNIKAEVKQGTKLPVYTSGTNNSNSTVSYIDAVLRLSVTPQITADHTIFMTVDIENTQPNGTASNGNYILTTQQETTQVLVSDGGTVVIGGVIQTTNSVSTSQTPFLGNIPLLGNLFKERLVKTETDELIFFITPKIVQM